MARRILFIVLCLSLAGCSRIPFLSSRYDNFTAYYNTFYNAKKAYESGVEALDRQDQPIDRNRYLPIFTTPDRAGSASNFDAAITKSADVLRDHPESKWVDDALLLIGKSYFYQQQYVGAEQKFEEVIEAGTSLEDEARFWLARTLIASRSYDRAEEHLRLSLGREGLSSRWEPNLRLALGELYVQRQAWEEAAVELEEGLQRLDDKDLGGRAQFLLGQVYETLGNYEAALEAYRQVDRYRPLYELSYAAQVSAIRVESEHGDPEEALRALRRMERDDKNYASRAELMYLRGRVYQAMGLADEAFLTYDELLYDSDANISNVRGQAHYALAELYRDIYRDYIFAAAHFDTAATSLRPGSQQAAGRQLNDVLAPEAITDAQEQSEIFESFATTAAQVAEMDSLLHLGQLPDEEFQAVVLELRKQRAAEAEAQQRELERQRAQERFRGGAQVNNRNATQSSTTTDGGDAGFLFHRNQARVQEGQVSFINRWGERPLVPNWRRQDAIIAAASENGDGDGLEAAMAGDMPLDPENVLPQVDVSSVPRDSASQAQMRAERAVVRYELGNVLFLSMNQPDSAAAWYRMVIEEDQAHPVAQRAYYALAEVQQTLGDSLAAQRLYQHILNAYPESELADRIRGAPDESVAPVVSDSLAMAEGDYALAYGTWQQTEYADAFSDMVRVALRYQNTDVAPRALLAAGSIYMEWARQDSLDLFASLPLADSLVEQVGLMKEPSTPPPDDSLHAVSDPSTNGAQLADTMQVADEVPLADSTQGANGVQAVDSMQTAENTQVVGGIQAAEEPVANLPALLSHLVERYPQSPQAQHAQQVLQALEERRAPPEPDSTATPALADQAAADTAGVQAEGPLPDELASGEATDFEEDTTRGAAAGASTWTIVVGSVMDEAEAQEVAASFTERLGAHEEMLDGEEYPVQVVSDAPGDNPRHRVGIGSFASRQEAETMRYRLSGMVDGWPSDAWVLEVPASEAAPAGPSVQEPSPADALEVQAALRDDPAQPKPENAPALNSGIWTIVLEASVEAATVHEAYTRYSQQLQAAGQPVELYPVETDEGTAYHIGLGRYKTQEEAEAMNERLTQAIPPDVWPEDASVMQVALKP